MRELAILLTSYMKLCRLKQVKEKRSKHVDIRAGRYMPASTKAYIALRSRQADIADWLCVLF
jgi:hypothetical protein